MFINMQTCDNVMWMVTVFVPLLSIYLCICSNRQKRYWCMLGQCHKLGLCKQYATFSRIYCLYIYNTGGCPSFCPPPKEEEPLSISKAGGPWNRSCASVHLSAHPCELILQKWLIGISSHIHQYQLCSRYDAVFLKFWYSLSWQTYRYFNRQKLFLFFYVAEFVVTQLQNM